jgi:polyisoprenoid-binding protein YceI
MNNKLLIGAIGLVFLFLAAGMWLYNWVLGDTLAASETISAPTIVIENTAVATQPPATPTQPIAEPTLAAQASNTSQQVQASENVETTPVVFEIKQSESEARFTIFEVLRGAPTDVIGRTDQVAGQIAIDFSELSNSQAGEILVNARTLATDDERRNQAIRNRILNTDQYEYIRFQPIEIIGLSGKAIPGQPFNFQIAGDLTIRDVTQKVVFEVTLTGESQTRITGVAKTTIQRSDYNLNIPDVPFVADVGSEVIIEIDFVLEVQ